MADGDILHLSLAVLERMAEEEIEGLAHGQITDWADFKRRRGRLSALEEAQTQIREAFRKRLDPDEDDEGDL